MKVVFLLFQVVVARPLVVSPMLETALSFGVPLNMTAPVPGSASFTYMVSMCLDSAISINRSARLSAV